jgi:hypothetical protein
MALLSEQDAEYVSQIKSEIRIWSETLISQKKKFEFKLTECKDQFMVVPMRFLSLACDSLCDEEFMSVDPASRRIVAYKFSENTISDTNRLKAVVARPGKSEKEATKSDPVPKHISRESDNVKLKAVDVVPKAKKAKTDVGPKALSVPVGAPNPAKRMNTILSFFPVIPTSTAQRASIKMQGNDENKQPLTQVESSSSSSFCEVNSQLHQIQQKPAQQTCKPKAQPVAQVLHRIIVTDIECNSSVVPVNSTSAAPSTSAQSTSASTATATGIVVNSQPPHPSPLFPQKSEEATVNAKDSSTEATGLAIMALLLRAFEANDGVLSAPAVYKTIQHDISEGCSAVTESQFYSFLNDLELSNRIMLDGQDIYQI